MSLPFPTRARAPLRRERPTLRLADRRRRARDVLLACMTACACVAGCSASPREDGHAAAPPQADAPPDTTGGVAFRESIGRDDVIVHGKVRAPNGYTPIAGALVHLSARRPTDRGPGCGACVMIDDSTAFARTGADGTFELHAHEGRQWLVIDKGRFRRVARVAIGPGEITLGSLETRLAGASDPSTGDAAPNVLVVRGASDPIERTLAKFGLSADSVRVVEDASSLAAADALDGFDMVLLPCGFGWEMAYDPSVQASVRRFVRRGGRLYAADYRYAFVDRIWQGALDWERTPHPVEEPCDACGSLYEAPATVDDGLLAAWLSAQNVHDWVVRENYTKVTAVHAFSAFDKLGRAPLSVPKVWVRGLLDDGRSVPTTVSFEDGCGRVVFSTHHTEADSSAGLVPQELEIVHVLFDDEPCVERRAREPPR
jgi:hypothetical protein